jgi:hypothetical protein
MVDNLQLRMRCAGSWGKGFEIEKLNQLVPDSLVIAQCTFEDVFFTKTFPSSLPTHLTFSSRNHQVSSFKKIYTIIY